MTKGNHLEVVYQKGVLQYFAKFKEKHLYWNLFFNKVAAWKPETLSENLRVNKRKQLLKI